MKYQAENAVSSFFYYMWNAWSKEECEIVFGGMCRHFWEKWNSFANDSIFGAAERFYASLSENNRKLLVERAVTLYDGKAQREPPNEELTCVCAICGFILFEMTIWIDADTGACTYVYDRNEEENWCEECDEVENYCTMKDFKEKMQSWWNSCDFRAMECITGMYEQNYPSNGGSQAFVNAATQWWNGQDYERKREIYNKHNSNKG